MPEQEIHKRLSYQEACSGNSFRKGVLPPSLGTSFGLLPTAPALINSSHLEPFIPKDYHRLIPACRDLLSRFFFSSRHDFLPDLHPLSSPASPPHYSHGNALSGPHPYAARPYSFLTCRGGGASTSTSTPPSASVHFSWLLLFGILFLFLLPSSSSLSPFLLSSYSAAALHFPPSTSADEPRAFCLFAGGCQVSDIYSSGPKAPPGPSPVSRTGCESDPRLDGRVKPAGRPDEDEEEEHEQERE
jgi:hypothetical protein